MAWKTGGRGGGGKAGGVVNFKANWPGFFTFRAEPCLTARGNGGDGQVWHLFGFNLDNAGFATILQISFIKQIFIIHFVRDKKELPFVQRLFRIKFTWENKS